ncbi:MAG TPA: hypothetical protein VLJ88_18575 [Propionibacteriaceae bacterium]|nr:hypothetical protein [Propionibacteriaceae bacterium]
MTARVITESYDGSTITVDATKVMGRTYVSMNTHEFDDVHDGADRDTLVYLTRAESDELIAALIAANQEIDAAARTPQTDFGDTDAYQAETTALLARADENARAAALVIDVAQAEAVATEVHGTEEPPAGAGAEDFAPCGAPIPGGPCDLRLGHPVGLFFPGHNGHMVSPELAETLSAARAELLANSTPVECWPGCPTCARRHALAEASSSSTPVPPAVTS